MLTRKQLELLDFIRQRVDADGVPPSFDEMKDALDLKSKSGIHRLITALEERGFIRRLAHRARALEILKLPEAMERPGFQPPAFRPKVITGDKPDAAPRRPAAAFDITPVDAMEMPLMGRSAAGVPLEAIAHGSHQVTVPNALLSGKGSHYALEVKGDSMIEAGINDGDIVIIREQQSADNGDIIVALVEDAEATLKRFRRRGGMIALEAANSAYETRVFPDHMVKVQGRLVGLIRSY